MTVIIKVSSGSDRAALRADGTTYANTSKTEINGGKIIGAKYGIQVWDGKPDVILRKLSSFENNDTDDFIVNANQKITIEETFKNNATVDCADPKDGRQLTTSTAGTDYYQKNLNLTSANEDYLVAYKKTESGEYHYLAKKVGVTISGLKSEIKAEDQAEFTVTLTHENSTGTGTLTFGDKNGEIEYKDENDKYVPMPNDGLPIDLASDKNDYAFRIIPQKGR